MPLDHPSSLEKLPLTYQNVLDYFDQFSETNLFPLRKEALRRIEKVTGRPIICYVTKTHHLGKDISAGIDHSDLTGFSDLAHSVSGESIDIFIVSNGGSPEATERIVALLRERFKEIRFVVPANAYSAATLMCLAGDEIVMGPGGTLGPIDPQFNDIPAREIQRAFKRLEEKVKTEGPEALATYMPQIRKYDLTILDQCETAQDLSEELARHWLITYMFEGSDEAFNVGKIIGVLVDYDLQKSHARSIGRAKARELGLKVKNIEDIEGLAELVQSLYNQYEFMFDRTPYYKLFENDYGIGWGRRATLKEPEKEPEEEPEERRIRHN